MTGFVFNGSLSGGVGLSPELARFMETGTPPIIFSLGSESILDDGSFHPHSVLAATLLGRRAVIVGASPSGYSVPGNSNLICVDYAPYDELFSRAAAVVHHGGTGTIALAMRAGCPMLLLPRFCWDQPDNAARVSALGVARMIPRQDYDAHSAASELAHLLGEPGYALRAAAISRIVRAEDGASSACDAIEQYLT